MKLPSGTTVKLRDPSLPSMMRRGIIPTRLFSAAMDLEKKKTEAEKKKEDPLHAVGADEFRLYCEFLAYIVCEAVVEPRVTLKNEERGKEGVVHYDEIPPEDIDALLAAVELKQGGNAGLMPANFPAKTTVGAG